LLIQGILYKFENKPGFAFGVAMNEPLELLEGEELNDPALVGLVGCGEP